MSPTHKRPTQFDVARLAGVSRATVSFVLNDTSGGIPIGEETRRKVLEAARNLNYTPDPIAQMLVTGSSDLIGVFTYEDNFPVDRSDFYYDFILGIEQAAANHNQNVILFTRHVEAGQPRRVYRGGTNRIRLSGGTIFLGATPDRDELARLHQENYPFVFIGRREVPGCEIDWVAVDYASTSRVAAAHLVGLGHTRLAYIGSDTHLESNQDKLVGIRHVTEGAGLPPITIFPEPALHEGARLLERLAASGCTAVLCSHSITFDVVMDTFKQAGIRTPEDYSVLSLADVSPNRLCDPNPTYISINRQRWGELAVEQLIERIRTGPGVPRQVHIPGGFVTGKTTGPYPTGRGTP